MITKQQRKALVFIEAEMERTGGVAPTVREIAAHFHYRSTSPARRRCMRAGQRTDVSPCSMARSVLIGLEQRGFISPLA